MQQALVHAGFTLDTDGVFGPATKEAVLKFQKQEGLHEDGIVGTSTLKALGLST